MPVIDPLTVPGDRNILIVTRRFPNGNGGTAFRGEILDATGWRHAHALVERRYATPMTVGHDDSKKVTVSIDGTDRTFLTAEYAEEAKSQAVSTDGEREAGDGTATVEPASADVEQPAPTEDGEAVEMKTVVTPPKSQHRTQTRKKG